MKIYTKTGDKGETSLFGGKRVSKADLRVEAYGTVDELNSAIGVVIAQFSIFNSQFSNKSQIPNLKRELISIQNDLLNIGSTLATPPSFWGLREKRGGLQNPPRDAGSSTSMTGLKGVLEKRVEEFEKMIDEMTKQLPELRNFILPGGGMVGSQLHFTRTLARRAERRIVALSKKEKIDQDIPIYFNRLSDLLFTMARFTNHNEKQKETIWNNSKV